MSQHHEHTEVPQRGERVTRPPHGSKEGATDVLKTMEEGEIPSSQQISTTIEGVTSDMDRTVERKRVHPRTRDVVKDTEAVLHDTKKFFEERNRGDRLQRLVFHGLKLSEDPRLHRPDYSDPRTREEALQGVNALRTLAIEMIRSAEFRNIASELIDIMGELFISRAYGTGGSEAEKSESREEESSKGTGTRPSVEGRRFSEPIIRPYMRGETGAAHQTQRSESKSEEKPKEGGKQWSNKETEELQDRSITLLRQLSKNDNFNHAMQAFLYCAENVKEWTHMYGEEQKKAVESNVHAQQALRDCRDLIEEFSEPGSTQLLIDKLQHFSSKLENDEEVQRLLKEIQDWLYDSMNNPDKLGQNKHVEKFEEFVERGQRVIHEYSYDDLTRDIFEQSRNILKEIQHDPLTRQFLSDLRRLIEDVTEVSPEGMNTTVMRELRDVLVPVIIRQLDYIPIPRIEDQGEKYDYWVDDIYVATRDILPENIKLRADASLQPMPSVQQQATEQGKEGTGYSDLKLKMKNIQANMEGVNFWFKRKRFPKREDSGYADVRTQDRGIRLSLKLRISNPTQPPVFRVRKCECEIDSLNIKVHDTRSNWLYNMFLKLFAGRIRTNVEQRVEERIVQLMDDINQRLEEQLQKQSSSSHATEREQSRGQSRGQSRV